MTNRCRKSAREVVAESGLEDDYLQGLLDAAAAGGWMVHHDGRSDLAQQIAGQAGFPDIVAAHPERGVVIAWEVKRDRGRHGPGQESWLDAFARADVETRTIWPDDYDEAWKWLVGDRRIKVRVAE